jgi:hypothetical protein
MKTLVRLSLVIAAICMLTGCESWDRFDFPEGYSNMLKTVTFSINNEFTTSFNNTTISKGSSSGLTGSLCRLEQLGSVTDAELGAFDVYLTCCWNPDDGSHSCTEGFLVDFEGNTLTLVCNDGDNGVVFTPDFPYDQTYICSKIEFTGGTGRFEGATGGGTIECDVKGNSNSIVHHWNASITLLIE